MVFSSPLFLSVFLPLVLLGYVLAPTRRRNGLLLAASLLFYSWGDPKAMPVMAAVILVTFWAGRSIGSRRSLPVLILAVSFDLGLLVFYKYLDFLILNFNAILALFSLPPLPLTHIPLPIGISFYIFQALSYLFDVHRGTTPAQTHLGRFALYISLFPQLIAGPIVRYDSIAQELNTRPAHLSTFSEGLGRFIIGLAKKVLLADNLAPVAESAFGAPPETLPCLWAWVGAVAFALQIYYDFSGYSDMAIGLGRIFGFTFPENFLFPYAATSLRDFWRRWHMSLTQWLRDYLYIPLGGSRHGLAITQRNILIVLLCCGLWHGASWNFLLWGLFHALGLISGRLLQPYLPQGRLWRHALRWWALLYILLGWVIFNTTDLHHAATYLQVMCVGNFAYDIYSLAPMWENCVTISTGLFFLVALGLSQPIGIFSRQNLTSHCIGQCWLAVLFVVTYASALTSSYRPFLYFRF